MFAPRDTVVTALHAQLSTLPTTALRGEVRPERVPEAGLLMLCDGEPGNRRPRCHRCATTTSTGALLAADCALGGLCDWVKAKVQRPVILLVEGAVGLQAGVIPVVLHHSIDDPLR